MILELDNKLWFPHPMFGESDGCIAYGGDLSPQRLKLAYSFGIFPWFSFRDTPMLWYCPMQRFVIFPHKIHISHSMRTLINKQQFKVTWDQCFEGVIHACSENNDRINMEGAWLGHDMIEAYTRMHDLGQAASVEVWQGGRLVGGLYGITLHNCFFGESMFSKVPSASKLALIFLARKLQAEGWRLIDCQLHTDHLESMGAEFIPYDQYLNIIYDNHPPKHIFPLIKPE